MNTQSEIIDQIKGILLQEQLDYVSIGVRLSERKTTYIYNSVQVELILKDFPFVFIDDTKFTTNNHIISQIKSKIKELKTV